MSGAVGAELAVEPILWYPREAETGKVYLLTVDLRPRVMGEDWPYADREEVVIYCRLKTAPLFRNEPLGEPAVVLHRNGGSYGPARFLLTAAAEPQEGTIQVTLLNGWGVPLTILETATVLVQEQPSRQARASGLVVSRPASGTASAAGSDDSMTAADRGASPYRYGASRYGRYGYYGYYGNGAAIGGDLL